MLRALGFLFLVLIVAAGVAVGILYHQDRQAREFATRAIPVVFEHYDHEAMMRRTIRELRNEDYTEGSRQMMQVFRQYLGPLESSGPLEGWIEYGRVDPSLPRSFFAKYTAQAKFKGGKGTLLLVVVKQDGAWRIGGFRVESPVLLDAMRKQSSSTT